MAWADTSYANGANYRDINGGVSSDQDTQRMVLEVAVSRLLDMREDVAPAHFAPQTAVTYDFRVSVGGSVLRLRDERGRQCLLRTATAIGIDTENDRTFDGVSLVLGTNAWVQGFPMNAMTEGEPYTGLELYSGVSGATISYWTAGTLVRVTGNWGWAAVPGSVSQRVVHITRQLVERGFGGPQVDIQQIAAAIDSDLTTAALLERHYQYGLPVFA